MLIRGISRVAKLWISDSGLCDIKERLPLGWERLSIQLASKNQLCLVIDCSSSVQHAKWSCREGLGMRVSRTQLKASVCVLAECISLTSGSVSLSQWLQRKDISIPWLKMGCILP